VFVVPGLDPTHHAEAPDVVEIDGLKPEKAEIGKVDPVAAILVASQVSLTSASYIVPRHSSTLPIMVARAALSASPSAPAWTTKRLHRESVFRFWVCMAILLMRKMGRPREIESERHQRAKGITRMLAGNRRQCGNRG
jgi:hypothetical protein